MKECKCPDCGQGIIFETEIIPLSKKVFICVECDALWGDLTEIGLPVVARTHHYFRSHGIDETLDFEKVQKRIRPLMV